MSPAKGFYKFFGGFCDVVVSKLYYSSLNLNKSNPKGLIYDFAKDLFRLLMP